jgi:hypothetical protein
MPKFVIERDVPGAGRLSADELRGLSQRSCAVLCELGPEIRWLESYVTDDKLYCLYEARDAGIIREHARAGGFPANRIAQVQHVIGPATANGAGR